MSPPRVIFLGHAAERTGPPIILLDLLRWIRESTDIEVAVALEEGGPLLEAYAELGPTTIVRDWLGPGPTDLASRALDKAGFDAASRRLRLERLRFPARGLGSWPLAYVNTAGCARLLPLLPEPPRRVIAHIHELSTGLDFHIEKPVRDLLFASADQVITVADAVTDEVVSMGLSPRSAITRIHGFIDPDPAATTAGPTRGDLGIPEDAFVIGSSGLRHWRKGPDLFVSLAQAMCHGRDDDPWFVWVGDDPAVPAAIAAAYDSKRAGLERRVRFVPHQANPRDWYRLFDVFALTAREDAFPLVCLEAASLGMPVVCFESGGMPEFVRDDAGVVIAYPDVEAMATAVAGLRGDAERRADMGRVGRERVQREHTVAAVAPQIVDVIRRVWAS